MAGVDREGGEEQPEQNCFSDRSTLSLEAHPILMFAEGTAAIGRKPVARGWPERFPAEAQFDLVVEGSSLNKLAREGDLIRCLDVDLAEVEVRDGDIVAIERRQGEDIELLGKRAIKQGEDLELWSESTLDCWRAPVIRHNQERRLTAEVRIIGKVLYAYRK